MAKDTEAAKKASAQEQAAVDKAAGEAGKQAQAEKAVSKEQQAEADAQRPNPVGLEGHPGCFEMPPVDEALGPVRDHAEAAVAGLEALIDAGTWGHQRVVFARDHIKRGLVDLLEGMEKVRRAQADHPPKPPEE